LVDLRAEIIEADLRPLYLAHLAASMDADAESTREAPVPAGLKKLSAAQRALVQFLRWPKTWVTAAAETSPDAAASAQSNADYARWLARQSAAEKDRWLLNVLEGKSAVRAEMLNSVRTEAGETSRSTIPERRTIAEISARAEQLTRRPSRRS